MKFLVNCDEATTICDKNQYGESTLSEKIRLSFHLLVCKPCKNYTKQNTLLTRVFGKYLTPCHDTEKLSDAEKQELKKSLEREIKNK